MFVDRKIPPKFDKPFTVSNNLDYPSDYFVNLHNHVVEYGTYNFNGARLKLSHSKINVDCFRSLLPSNFDDLSILQYMEFGFPLGLDENFTLLPVLRNHSSSYNYFTHVDEFISTEVGKNWANRTF